MIRQHCAICLNPNLETMYTVNAMPASLSITKEEYTTDIFCNQEVCMCANCKCIQLKQLVDPELLYKNAHNTTYNSPTWNEHHIRFSEFILHSCNHPSITEIGGSSGILYSKLKGLKQYTCIDMCKPTFDASEIEYIVGNCEEIKYKEGSCIAMSHVFEHLYNPNRFVSVLADCKVDTVYISIPNLQKLLERKSLSVLHFEHTYFIDKEFSEFLFSQYGYELVRSETFKEHSLFLEFKYTQCQKMSLPPRQEIPNAMVAIFKERSSVFSELVFKPNSFIIPAGHMGQLVYTLAKSKHILGFLDNDTSKQFHRQYGTPHMIYPFDKLNEYTCPIHVYIYAGPYLNELLKQLDAYTHVSVTIL